MVSTKFLKFLYVAAIFGVSFCFLAAPVHAQYFGRNKVQYESFNFKVMKTEHFDIHFYPEFQESAKHAARMAERWYKRLSRIFHHNLTGRQILILYSSSPHFQQTAAIPGILGEGTGGVTEMFKRRIVLPLGASLAESDHVIGHELVHAFQVDITSQGAPAYAAQTPAMMRIPLWMVEGLAEYLSIGSVDPQTSMWMRDVTRRDKLPTVKKLANSYKYFPYRYGQSLWAYITGKWGDSKVSSIMKSVGRARNYEQAIQSTLGVSLEELSKGWHESMKKAYNPLTELTQIQDEYSRILFRGTEENRLNLAPSLSPDGKQIIFLSTKDMLSVDLFLADAETGKIKRKLISTAVDPHFESIQFIKSAGGWDAEGRRFAFGAISKGQPVLYIVNTMNNRREREIMFQDLGEILNPTWSPDGRYIAFSALSGGVSDLFIYDLETEFLRKMTDDPYADLQPAWSPDGRRIAFVTDRFSTDLSILSIGKYELALVDPQSAEITKIQGFIRGHNINPQWSSDSGSVYFISDVSGISNLYRVELKTGTLRQMTNLYTGVGGITSLSPALSVASDSGKAAYSLYEEGNFSIYSFDTDNSEGAEEFTEFGDVLPSALPPRTRGGGEILGLLKNPLYGLPEEKEYESEDYKAKLSLDYISPPQLAVGADRFGTYAGGGIAMFFSDVLGYHSLSSMVQVTSRIEDSSFLVGYQNKKSRLMWGGVAQRIPYIYGGYSMGISEVMGEPVYIEQEYIYRQINYQLSGFAAYPFSRVQRFELSGGYRFLDFDNDVYTRAFSMIDGRLLFRDRENLPAAPSLHFVFGSAALVRDTSLFGATSPLLGQSYRFEVSPYIGSISFYNVLADFRKYVMPIRPFTLAFRFLHYGRYGRGADDDRLYPLFIGYESLVRGYNYGSFSIEECGSGAEECFTFDRLFGSKLMVANLELRFPLLRMLGIGKGYYGVLPLEFIAFYDIGVAWSQMDKAWFQGGRRKPVSSAGVGVRINLFGYAILGVSYVHPFDRPLKGSYFQFTIMPGF
jgi:Tol biopolymer transport system component